MQVTNPWQAAAQSPRRFLQSRWPWRALVFVLGGAAVVIAVAATSLVTVYGQRWVLPLLMATVLLVNPKLVVWWERRRLELIHPAPLPEYQERLGVEFGYTSGCVLGLWPLDFAVVAAISVPQIILANLLMTSSSGVKSATALAAMVVLLVLAPYLVAGWAGARAAHARLALFPNADVKEVIQSRARLADAFEVERRRIERDLHDGAQQRLVALTMTLGLARLDLAADSPAAARVSTAHEQAKLALGELRELIRGVHPQILTDRGLPAAIADAAGRSPLPVDVDVQLPRRLPAAIEAAMYFAVCEALTNVAQHSRADRASVRGRLDRDLLTVEVRDDGAGGADPASGTGLTGLADRIATVGGRLLLSSPVGGPTLLRLEIPCPTAVDSA